ncbi:kinetochore protein Mis12 [Mactra antiquata]
MEEQSGEDYWTIHDDYAVQYFGFVPQTLFNGMYNVIWEYTKEAMSTLNENVLFTFKEKISEEELHSNSLQQKKMAMDRLNAKFDKAECYMNNNVFQIPKHIVLPEDKINVDAPCTVDEMKQLDDELHKVLDNITAVKYANSQLQEQIKKIGHVQNDVDNVLFTLDKIHYDVSTQSQNLTNTTKNYHKVMNFLEKNQMTSDHS